MPFGATTVASSPLRLRAIFGNVPYPVAVIALGPLDAITGQVSNATAGIAGLSASSSTKTARSCLGAAPRNVSDLATFVAFGVGSAAVSSSSRGFPTLIVIRAVAGNMSRFVTLVARLGLGLHRAVTRDVPFNSTVVARRGTGLGALSSLMTDCSNVQYNISSPI